MTDEQFAQFRDGQLGIGKAYRTPRGSVILPLARGCSFDNITPCPNPISFVVLSGSAGATRLMCADHARRLIEDTDDDENDDEDTDDEPS